MLDISADFRALERALADIPQKQLPFAMMMALNDTAKDVKFAEERQIDRIFDRPTPFTKRGIYVKRATKSGLTTEIGVKRVQAKYLRLQAKGGVRLPKRRAIVIGAGLRRNKYGNLPRGAMKRAEAKDDTFVSKGEGRTAHLKPGIYRRPPSGKYRRGGAGNKNRGTRKGPTMLVAFQPRAKYKRRLPFHATAKRTAEAVLERHLSRRIKEAVKTAR